MQDTDAQVKAVETTTQSKLGGPGTGIGSSTFGTLTQANDVRPTWCSAGRPTYRASELLI